MNVETGRCPVCRRNVLLTAWDIVAHRDNTYRRCPASGYPKHITNQEGI